MPSTALAPRRRRMRAASQKALSSRSPPVAVCSRPLPRRPLKASTSSGIWVGGTRVFSMPVAVPSQLTLQPRRCTSRATAMPGMMWPPVPAAMMTRCGITLAPHA